jgi:hypothetical protein
MQFEISSPLVCSLNIVTIHPFAITGLRTLPFVQEIGIFLLRRSHRSCTINSIDGLLYFAPLGSADLGRCEKGKGDNLKKGIVCVFSIGLK